MKSPLCQTTDSRPASDLSSPLSTMTAGAVDRPVTGRIRVKLLSKTRPGEDAVGWLSRFPGERPFWGNCEFIFDRHCRDYDWLVVYNDMPSVRGERHTLWEEPLACPRQNTLFVTYEPSTIKVYGNRFLAQFGWVLTSQEPWVIRHPGVIFNQPGFIWYYAFSQPRGSYDAISRQVPLAKTHAISTVCSAKKQRNTLHRQRYEFVLALKQHLPALELFGRGFRIVADKAEALDPFKYHLAIENFFGPHHWTEKLADAFLGACMPVYHGCPNAEEYFPPESFLRVDINNVEAAVERVKRALRDNLYEKHLEAVLESRRRVLKEYAPVAQFTKIINERHQPDAPRPRLGESILSRHLFRRRSVVNLVSFGLERAAVSLRHRLDRKPAG